jgi:hypothetical protein
MRRRFRHGAAFIIGFVILAGAATGLMLLPRPAKAPPIGGAFVLTDQDGQRITEQSLLKKPSAIFFGFTSCPDICPSTLLELTNWVQALGTDADKLNVVFVSVDSEHDTPEQMKLYLSSFDPHIRGFTGTADQIKKSRGNIEPITHVSPRRRWLDLRPFCYRPPRGLVTYKEPEASAQAKLRALIAGKSLPFTAPYDGKPS